MLVKSVFTSDLKVNRVSHKYSGRVLPFCDERFFPSSAVEPFQQLLVVSFACVKALLFSVQIAQISS